MMNRNSRMWLLKHSLYLNCSFFPRVSIPGHFSGTYRPPTTPQHEFPHSFHTSVSLCHRPMPDSLVRRPAHWGSRGNPHRRWVTRVSQLVSSLGWSNGQALTHAVLHHHESAFIAFIALALKVPRGVHTLASATEVRGYAAFINICTRAVSRQQVSIRTALLLVATR